MLDLLDKKIQFKMDIEKFESLEYGLVAEDDNFEVPGGRIMDLRNKVK